MKKRSLFRTGSRGARRSAKLGAMAAAIPAATLITLGHRIPMVLMGAVDAKARRNPELTRMVVEKTSAAAKSAEALGKGGAIAGAELARYAARQGQASARVAAALISPNPAMALQRLWAHGQISADLLADLGVRLGEIAARTAHRSLAPAHTAVTANASRLAIQARSKRTKT